jgi:hypothetical protein
MKDAKKADQPEPTPFEKFRALTKRVIDAGKPEPAKAKQSRKQKARKNMRGRGS